MSTSLTVTLDEDLLRAARKVALDRNTSVNQLVRDFLAGLVSEADRHKDARERLQEIFRTTGYEMGPRTWTREDLYARR